MRKIIYIALAIIFSTLAFSQKKEKVKGSKIVTVEQKKVDSFDAIEVHDDLEVYLIKGDTNGVELEADDNLQDALALTWNGSTLIISAAKEITSFKKFNIRITYTDSFKQAVAKDKSKINALEEMALEDVTFQSFDNAKMYLNINTKTFSLIGNDKSHIEINAKSESGAIDLSKNAELKALISSTELKCDLYQKAAAIIEGDVIDMKLRLDNNSNFTGKKLTAKNIKLLAEGYSNCNVFAETSISIEATGNTEIQLFGEPKIGLLKFSDNAVLYKKPIK
jgi:hypothetical protein